MGVGVVAIYTSSSQFAIARGYSEYVYVKSHISKLIMGVMALCVGMVLPRKIWEVLSIPLFFFSLLLTIMLFFGDADAINGAKRWVRIFGVQFQPSELIKISLILFLSQRLSASQDQLDHIWHGMIKLVAGVIIVVVLLMLQPNYSMVLIISMISVGMMIAGGVRMKHLALAAAASLPFLVFLAFSSAYRLKRILAFLSPDEHTNSSYQQLQSLISLGNGGITGTGLGEGTQRLGFLPMPFTDTIFAIFGEETGFIGTTLVIGLYMVLTWRGLVVAMNATSVFARLVATGITLSVFANAFLHIGVCVKALPATGQPLPLISLGGTSLIMTLFALGILLNISQDNYQSASERRLQRMAR
jgi:cell division protein FtsW